MNKIAENNINEIIEGLESKELEMEATSERILLPEERLRNSLLNLVQKQSIEASRYDSAIGLAVSSLEDKIKTNELSTSELLNIVSTLSNKKVDLIAGVLEPFKPTPNGINVLMPPIKEKEKSDDFTEGLKNMAKEDLHTLNSLFNKLSH